MGGDLGVLDWLVEAVTLRGVGKVLIFGVGATAFALGTVGMLCHPEDDHGCSSSSSHVALWFLVSHSHSLY